MIGERTLGGVLYYWLAREYESARTAKAVFDNLQAEGGRQKGKLDLGVYRCAHVDDLAEARVLAIVSLNRKSMEWVDKVVGGETYDGLTPGEIDSLMARRVRVVAPIYKSGRAKHGGQVVIRRGKRGAKLFGDGVMEEPVGRDD